MEGVMKSTLKQTYQEKIAPTLAQSLGRKNSLSAPRLEKIVVNVGIGEAASNKEALKKPAEELAAICGQRPKIAQAKKGEASFGIRRGDPVGLMVTLRGVRMYHFFEKLVKIVLPRLRDFRGVSTKSFDGRGNYSLGLPEQIVFPEVDDTKVEKIRGLEVALVTSAKTDEEARLLLEKLGMPFEKVG